jgi:hypothetical protein
MKRSIGALIALTLVVIAATIAILDTARHGT